MGVRREGGGEGGKRERESGGEGGKKETVGREWGWEIGGGDKQGREGGRGRDCNESDLVLLRHMPLESLKSFFCLKSQLPKLS